MQVSPISANRTNYSVNPQKQASFSGVNVHKVMPEFSNLIEHGVKGEATVYPVIKELPSAIQDNVLAKKIISLTGLDALAYREKGADMNAFREVVQSAEKNRTIANA